MKVESEVVEGRAIRVGDRQLVPVVRRTVGVWRRATIAGGVSARGGAFVRLQPVGLIERGEGEGRFVPLPDPTRAALLGMAVVGAVVAAVACVAGWLASRRGEEG